MAPGLIGDDLTSPMPPPTAWVEAVGRQLALTGVLLTSMTALADGAADAAQRHRQFQTDREICLSGASNQSRQDCLREAGAVLQQKDRGTSLPDAAQLQANAEQRCAVLPEADRSSCLLRMRGKGYISGSVGGGGIYRELEEPAAPAQ